MTVTWAPRNRNQGLCHLAWIPSPDVQEEKTREGEKRKGGERPAQEYTVCLPCLCFETESQGTNPEAAPAYLLPP